MRVGIIRDWDAKWYAEKEYADYLHEDLAIRKFVQKELADAAVSTIEIERAVNKVNVSLHTAKPGMVIGKGGANVDALRAKLNKLTGKMCIRDSSNTHRKLTILGLFDILRQINLSLIHIYLIGCSLCDLPSLQSTRNPTSSNSIKTDLFHLFAFHHYFVYD